MGLSPRGSVLAGNSLKLVNEFMPLTGTWHSSAPSCAQEVCSQEATELIDQVLRSLEGKDSKTS